MAADSTLRRCGQCDRLFDGFVTTHCPACSMTTEFPPDRAMGTRSAPVDD